MDVSEPPDYRFCYHRCCLQVLQLLLEFFQVLFPVLYYCLTLTSEYMVSIFLRCTADGTGMGILLSPVENCFVKSTFIAE